jgi:hypothetical protein
MAYRGKRNLARETVAGDTKFYHSGVNDVKSSNTSEDEESEDNKRRHQNGLPKINNGKQKNTRKTMEESRSLAPSMDSRIPVAKRGPPAKRVPNSRRHDQVTPVRERFRARHQEYELASTTEDQRKDYNKNTINNVSKKVTFYRNGDKHFKGRSFIITKQRYRSFENLLEDLSKSVPLPYGVRNVFSPRGHIINSINELEDGGYYICSSGDQLIRNIDYYNAEKRKENLANEIPSEGIRNISLSVPTDTSKSSSPRANNRTPKPRIITIINEERTLKCKILLNRKTAKSYEDILRDISEMMKLRGEFVQELYSSQKGSKVSYKTLEMHRRSLFKLK